MRFKNNHPVGEIDVPVLRRIIPAGEIFDVPEDLAEGFASQPTNFEPTDKPAKDLAKQLSAPDEADAATEGDTE